MENYNIYAKQTPFAFILTHAGCLQQQQRNFRAGEGASVPQFLRYVV